MSDFLINTNRNQVNALKNNPFFYTKGEVSAWEIPGNNYPEETAAWKIPGNNYPEETAAWKIPGNNFPEETATWQILGNNFFKEQYPAKF